MSGTIIFRITSYVCLIWRCLAYKQINWGWNRFSYFLLDESFRSFCFVDKRLSFSPFFSFHLERTGLTNPSRHCLWKRQVALSCLKTCLSPWVNSICFQSFGCWHPLPVTRILQSFVTTADKMASQTAVTSLQLETFLVLFYFLLTNASFRLSQEHDNRLLIYSVDGVGWESCHSVVMIYNGERKFFILRKSFCRFKDFPRICAFNGNSSKSQNKSKGLPRVGWQVNSYSPAHLWMLIKSTSLILG